MTGYFELKKSVSTGDFMFNLKAGNHEVILTSEQYKAKKSAEDGIASVQGNCSLDDRFERKTSKRGEPYFNLKAANGQVIGHSQMYAAASSMENGIASVMKNGPNAIVADLTS